MVLDHQFKNGVLTFIHDVYQIDEHVIQEIIGWIQKYKSEIRVLCLEDAFVSRCAIAGMYFPLVVNKEIQIQLVNEIVQLSNLKKMILEIDFLSDMQYHLMNQMKELDFPLDELIIKKSYDCNANISEAIASWIGKSSFLKILKIGFCSNDLSIWTQALMENQSLEIFQIPQLHCTDEYYLTMFLKALVHHPHLRKFDDIEDVFWIQNMYKESINDIYSVFWTGLSQSAFEEIYISKGMIKSLEKRGIEFSNVIMQMKNLNTVILKMKMVPETWMNTLIQCHNIKILKWDVSASPPNPDLESIFYSYFNQLPLLEEIQFPKEKGFDALKYEECVLNFVKHAPCLKSIDVSNISSGKLLLKMIQCANQNPQIECVKMNQGYGLNEWLSVSNNDEPDIVDETYLQTLQNLDPKEIDFHILQRKKWTYRYLESIFEIFKNTTHFRYIKMENLYILDSIFKILELEMHTKTPSSSFYLEHQKLFDLFMQIFQNENIEYLVLVNSQLYDWKVKKYIQNFKVKNIITHISETY